MLWRHEVKADISMGPEPDIRSLHTSAMAMIHLCIPQNNTARLTCREIKLVSETEMGAMRMRFGLAHLMGWTCRQVNNLYY